jgi:hypothetical protein
MPVKVNYDALIEMLDQRIRPTLPTVWPGKWGVRSSSIRDQMELLRHNMRLLEETPPDVALALLVENVNEALYQYSDGVSEDACEPCGGMVTIDRDQLRVRFGLLPRADPDAGHQAAELEAIPIGEILIST